MNTLHLFLAFLTGAGAGAFFVALLVSRLDVPPPGPRSKP